MMSGRAASSRLLRLWSASLPAVRQSAAVGPRAAEIAAMAGLAVELLGLWALMRSLEIESRAFWSSLVPLAFVGACAAHWLPRAWRLRLFAGLSIVAVLAVFGRRDGTALLGIGCFLIALAHLPVGIRTRALLLVTSGAGLALARADLFPVPFQSAVWPILASMFIFRLVAYLHDLPHQKEPVSWERVFSYFFMLPNLAFPLFPVVDFNTFKRTYYDRPALEIYRRGVDWIVRGLVQLLVYRAVYQYATLSPSDVETGTDLVRYAVANYGLYLRVSGQFHVSVGILHLFGFRLPETHRLYYLSSSLTDYYRRINIYWTDLMMKLVFYPMTFRIRRWGGGEKTVLAGATMAVFLVTWAAHSYQWFWLLGTWLWSATDALFWASLGLLMVANALRELRRGRQRRLGAAQLTLRARMGLGLRTAATFSAICALWAFWASPTLDAFAELVGRATWAPRDLLVVCGTFAALVLAGFAAAPWSQRTGEDEPASASAWGIAPRTLGGAALLTVVAVGGSQGVISSLPPRVATVLRDLSVASLNNRDAEQLQQGYYERLVGVDRFNGELWSVYARTHGRVEGAVDADLMMRCADDRIQALRPLLATTFKGVPLRTNRWGMRDDDYSPRKPPDTWRLALFGQSYVMGSGVGDGEDFTARVERRLNDEPTPTAQRRVEILNFAAPAYSLFQHAALLESGRVHQFEPDAVLVVGHVDDFRFVMIYVVNAMEAARIDHDEALAAVVRDARIERGMPKPEAMRRLAPFEERLVSAAFARIASAGTLRGMRPVYALIPTPATRHSSASAERLLRLAETAGLAVMDLSGLYTGLDETALVVSQADRHPNAAAHEVIADRFYRELLTRRHLIGATAQ